MLNQKNKSIKKASPKPPMQLSPEGKKALIEYARVCKIAAKLYIDKPPKKISKEEKDFVKNYFRKNKGN